MKYVTPEGFAEYSGETFSNIAQNGNISTLLESVETRILAYIIPNVPNDMYTLDAFCKACYAQLVYEQSDAVRQMADMPAGMKSFTVNGFSATLDGRQSAVVPAGICPEARALLLTSGLLYRGVNCRC